MLDITICGFVPKVVCDTIYNFLNIKEIFKNLMMRQCQNARPNECANKYGKKRRKKIENNFFYNFVKICFVNVNVCII